MYLKNDNSLVSCDIADVKTSARSADVCIVDEGLEENDQLPGGHIDTDFAGALRLLLFSDKIIQPFEKKFIIDALALGLDSYDQTQQKALAVSLTKTGKISATLADKLLLKGSFDAQKILLEKYAYHSEHALCALAEDADSDVLLLMAQRDGLTNDVVHALLKRGMIEIVHLVLENKTADRDASVIERLLVSQLCDEIAAVSLLNLPDMEPSKALELFWHMPASIRLIILRRFLKSHVLVEGHFARMHTPNLRALPLFSASGECTLNPEAVAQGMQAAIDCFKQGQIDNALKHITLCVPLPLSLLQKIMCDRSGEAVVILLKALGLSRDLSQIYLTSLSESPLAGEWSDLGCLYEVYDVISWGEARMALSYWLWQIERLGPYQPLDEDRFLEKISSMEFSDDLSREAVSGE